MSTTTADESKRTSDNAELRLVALPVIHLLRSQMRQVELMADYLKMDVEHVVRSALVEYARRPAFDALLHRKEPTGPKSHKESEDDC